jgi:hypothetical protein
MEVLLSKCINEHDGSYVTGLELMEMQPLTDMPLNIPAFVIMAVARYVELRLRDMYSLFESRLCFSHGYSGHCGCNLWRQGRGCHSLAAPWAVEGQTVERRVYQ